MITTDTAAMLALKKSGTRLAQHEVTFSYVDAETWEPTQLDGIVWAPADTTDVAELKRVAIATYAPSCDYEITAVTRVTLAGTTVLA